MTATGARLGSYWYRPRICRRRGGHRKVPLQVFGYRGLCCLDPRDSRRFRASMAKQQQVFLVLVLGGVTTALPGALRFARALLVVRQRLTNSPA